MTARHGILRLMPVLTGLAALQLLAAWAGIALAQQLVRQEDAVVALFSLQTELEVDLKIMERIELRHEANRRARDEAGAGVARLYADLDRLFEAYRAALRAERRHGAGRGGVEDAGREQRTPESLEAEIRDLEERLQAAERRESGLRDEGRRLREEIQVQRERLTLLAQRISALQASLPSQRDAVTGIWDLTLLPVGQRGVFALFQSGTLVTGQYVLDGPFQGSLEGTLVDRRILLHRIDSRLGRSMDFSGDLSEDGQAIRGTWENYDLSDGQARSGAWSARRRQPDEDDASGDQEGTQP